MQGGRLFSLLYAHLGRSDNVSKFLRDCGTMTPREAITRNQQRLPRANRLLNCFRICNGLLTKRSGTKGCTNNGLLRIHREYWQYVTARPRRAYMFYEPVTDSYGLPFHEIAVFARLNDPT